MNTTLRNTLLIVSGLYVLFGLALVLWPDNAKAFICYLLGAALLLYGVISTISYFTNNKMGLPLNYGFLFGVVSIVLGAFFLLKVQSVISAFGFIIGGCIILDSIIKLQFALELWRMDSAAWVKGLLFSLVMLIIGILLLLQPFRVSNALTVFTGIALFLDAIANAWCILDVNRLLS